MKLSRMLYVGLALVAGATLLTSYACNKGDVPSVSGPSLDESMTASAPASTTSAPAAAVEGTGVCEGKETLKSIDGKLNICVLETNLQLADDRCQTAPANGDEWVYKIGIVNNTGSEGYFLDDIFTAPANSCGAAGGNGYHGDYYNKKFPVGESTYTFIITRPADRCGRDQEDFAAIAGTSRLNFRGIVFNYSRSCTCADYTAPTITGDISSDVQTAQVVFDKGTVAPAGGSFDPTLPKTVARPNAGQSAASFSTAYTLPYGPSAELQCKASKTFTKPVPPKGDTCDNYTPTPPTFGGALALTNETATTEKVTAGSVSPAGGTWSDPLPKTVNRPEYGSTLTFSDTYTKVVSYGPENLRCSKSYDHQYDISIPAKACPKANVWTLTNETDEAGIYTIVVVTNKSNPAGSIVESFDLARNAHANFSGYNNQQLHAFFKIAHTDPLLYVYYMHDSSSHAREACQNDGGTWLDGDNHVCNTPHRHGNSGNNYKWSHYYWEYDAYYQGSTGGGTSYTYEFADSETSGSCGAVTFSSIAAQCRLQASLKVECQCQESD